MNTDKPAFFRMTREAFNDAMEDPNPATRGAMFLMGATLCVLMDILVIPFVLIGLALPNGKQKSQRNQSGSEKD